jgi:hypothetical protein
MKTTRIRSTAALFLLFTVFGCRRNPEPLPMSLDTIRASSDTTGLRQADTSHAKSDTARSNLPPMAKAIDPTRLAQFLPKMPGWALSGEIEHEIQVHDNFNRSRVAQTYTNGPKKVKIEINDYAYVPYLYDAWQKFKGIYLDDDNFARTETTTIAGYHAVQTMEKKDPHGSVTVFPGNRYVVTVVLDGADNINDVRRIAESMDLKGFETLQ